MAGQWSSHRIVKEVGIVGSMLYRNHCGNILNIKEVKATKHLKQSQNVYEYIFSKHCKAIQNVFSLLQKNNKEILLNVFTMFEVQTLAWNFSFFDNVFMMFTTQTSGIVCCVCQESPFFPHLN